MARLRRATGPRRSTEEWRALMTRFGASGLGVAAFCQQEAISEASFYRWRGLLADTGIEANSIARAPAGALVDLGPLAPQQPGVGRIEIRLDLGAGMVLHLVRG